MEQAIQMIDSIPLLINNDTFMTLLTFFIQASIHPGHVCGVRVVFLDKICGTPAQQAQSRQPQRMATGRYIANVRRYNFQPLTSPGRASTDKVVR